jgi:rhamnogalacturonyl hydrolase YesR
LLQQVLAEKGRLVRSPLHAALVARMERPPLKVAGILASRYPRVPEIAYIQAVTWSSTLRLAELTGDARWRDQVARQLAPYLRATPPDLNARPDVMVVRLAGHIALADLAAVTGNADARRLALQAAEAYRPEQPGGIARFGSFWCEDMFMKATLLGRAARLADDPSYADLSARTIRHYAEKLQYPTGLFHHALDGPIAWGRGNGFAALGLMEALTYVPRNHPDRKALVAACRKQMAALRPLQTPEGTWRQVVDHPESYREVTVTAMTLAAMARGVRLGWLGKEYRPVIRRAWSGLSARIADDGTLTDVCVGTGAGPDLRHYYDRPAASGYDDRGGAMCLLAAVEVAALEHSDKK